MEKQKETILIPLPDSGSGPAAVTDITGLFTAVSEGLFEARLTLPASGRHLLRFSRVGCRAVLKMQDGKGSCLSASHFGSYTDWDVELTGLSGGVHISLSLAADEKTMSPWQKTGILGSIHLLSVPEIYLCDLYIRTSLSSAAGEPGLTVKEEEVCSPDSFLISFRLAEESAEFCQAVSLTVTGGSDVCTRLYPVSPESSEMTVCVKVPGKPHLWCCEDPWLYEISLGLMDADGQLAAQYTRKAGLAEISRDGCRLLLNGSPVKLFGLVYREPLAFEGFSPAEDLRLFKEANVNYLRSLYYPFSEEFLSLCDEAGIFVEQSASVTGLGQTLPANQNAPALRPLFDRMYAEMVLAARSHPCVLLWSLGDDCVWGDNFERGLSRIKALDPGRPVNFHLPMTIPQEEWVPDVWSVHYSSPDLPADACFDQMVIFHTQGAENAIGYATAQADGLSVPVLHDAFALVPVYDLEDLDRDPGVHEFWGQSIARFAQLFRRTEGCLGGAVMAAVDEDGSFHPSLTGYGWGVLDASHRPKPEYHHPKMAYGKETHGGEPAGTAVSDTSLPDKHMDAPAPDSSNPPVTAPVRLEKDSRWLFTGTGFTALLDPATGLFTEISSNGQAIILGGPYLHTGRYPLGAWHLTSLEANACRDGFCIVTEGEYEKSARVRFTTLLSGDGEIQSECEVISLSRPMPHRVKAGIGLDPGGLTEFGISWLLSPAVAACDFTRTGLWPEYPSDHIGRNEGTALRENVPDFTAQKFSVRSACIRTAQPEKGAAALTVIPVGETNLRLAEVPAPSCLLTVPGEDCETASRHSAPGDGCGLASLSLSGDWYTVRDDAGGIGFSEIMAKDKGCRLDISFEGTGLTVRGTTDRIRGFCDIEIDGKTVARGISQHTPGVYFASMSRGYEKRYHQVLFATDSLTPGRHCCRVLVTGERETASQENWISIESVEVNHPEHPRGVMLYINKAVNYPRLVYGNYMNDPILIGPGDKAACRLRLSCGSSSDAE